MVTQHLINARIGFEHTSEIDPIRFRPARHKFAIY
jgi:hypothetical protein